MRKKRKKGKKKHLSKNRCCFVESSVFILGASLSDQEELVALASATIMPPIIAEELASAMATLQ